MRPPPGLAALLALTLAPLAHADPDVRLAVERLLRDIEAAVLTADADAYLALVDRSEPHFAVEQANWAKDLRTNTPADFSMTLAEDGFTVGDGSAEGTVTLAWRLTPAPGLPADAPAAKPRSVSWPARFVTGDSPSGWLYAGEVWDAHRAPGTLVLHEDGLDATATLAAELLPPIRERVHEGFEVGPDAPVARRTQVVKLYRSMPHLQASIYLSYTDSLGGWNEPGESIKLLARESTGRRTLEDRLAHEYAHVLTFEMGPRATDMPWWVLEGVANLAAQAVTGSPGPDAAVERWARAGELAAWDDLARFDEAGRRKSRFVYAQGHHMVAYVTDRFGRTARNAWMRSMAQGATLDEATRTELGLSFEALDADWRASLPAPAAPTP